jgi:hypothetical protein
LTWKKTLIYQNCGDDDVLAFNANLVKVGKFRDLVKFAFNDSNQIPDTIFELLRKMEYILIRKMHLEMV